MHQDVPWAQRDFIHLNVLDTQLTWLVKKLFYYFNDHYIYQKQLMMAFTVQNWSSDMIWSSSESLRVCMYLYTLYNAVCVWRFWMKQAINLGEQYLFVNETNKTSMHKRETRLFTDWHWNTSTKAIETFQVK